MARQQKKADSWLGLTILMVVILAGIFFFLLFPAEAYAAVEDYLGIALLVIILVVGGLLIRRFTKDIKSKSADKKEAKRKKQIQLIEQLIWRSRYSLQAKKAQILADDTAEAREQWKQEKIRYAKEKIFPVIPESQAPMNLVSSLIEKSLSGSGLGSGRLPTYNVRNL